MKTGKCVSQAQSILGGAKKAGAAVVNFAFKGAEVAAATAAAPFLWVFNILLYAVFGVLGIWMMLAGVLLDWALNPNNFAIVITNNAGIYESWKFVRDLFNIFFIFILLFAAFATIFQVDKYSYKKILLKLIIMALLVNFSFPISRFIIDVSNVFLYGILSSAGLANNDSVSDTLKNGLGIMSIVAPDTSFKEIIFDAQSLTIKLIFSNIFLFIAAITFLIIGVLFIIRIAVLAVLIIFSPVGFVAGAFPGTQKFADEWWDLLIKQSFFAPVMALMLVIALNVMKSLNTGGVLAKSIQLTTRNNVAIQGDYSSLIVSAATMAIPTIILWLGMLAAQKFGAIGADVVMKSAKWFGNFSGKGAWGAAKWGGSKIDTKLAGSKGGAKFLSPSVLKGTWDSWRKDVAERDKDTVELGVAGAQSQIHKGIAKVDETLKKSSPRLHKMFSPYNLLYKDRTDYGHLKQSEQAKKYLDEIKMAGGGSLVEDMAVRMMYEAADEKDAEHMLGAALGLSQVNGLDRVVSSFWNDDRYFSKEEQEKMKEDFNGKKVVNIQRHFPAVLRRILEKNGMSDEEINKHMYAIGENAKNAGDFAMGDLVALGANGEFVALEGPDRDAAIAASAKKVRGQRLWEGIHGRSLHEQFEDVEADAKGEKKRYWGDIHGAGEEIIKATFNAGTAGSIGRARPDFVESFQVAEQGGYKKHMGLYNVKDGAFRAVSDKMMGRGEKKESGDKSAMDMSKLSEFGKR